MDATELPIISEVSPVQLAKAKLPMEATELPMVAELCLGQL